MDYSNSPVQQTVNNATSWIGHRNFDNKDVATGQSFVASSDGDLQSIEIFPTVVTKPGKVLLTVYELNEQTNEWGSSLGSATVDFNKDCNGKWVPFELKGLHLQKGRSYAFKLESGDTYIGVGEAAGSAKQPPFANGKEWKFTNNQSAPRSFRYFSLAFKLGLRAA